MVFLNAYEITPVLHPSSCRPPSTMVCEAVHDPLRLPLVSSRSNGRALLWGLPSAAPADLLPLSFAFAHPSPWHVCSPPEDAHLDALSDVSFLQGMLKQYFQE